MVLPATLEPTQKLFRKDPDFMGMTEAFRSRFEVGGADPSRSLITLNGYNQAGTAPQGLAAHHPTATAEI